MTKPNTGQDPKYMWYCLFLKSKVSYDSAKVIFNYPLKRISWIKVNVSYHSTDKQWLHILSYKG
jgi:hypothetical protein